MQVSSLLESEDWPHQRPEGTWGLRRECQEEPTHRLWSPGRFPDSLGEGN